MLPFLSINVVHSELPDCLFQFCPNEVKMPKVIEDGKSYQNVLTNVFNIWISGPKFVSLAILSQISIFFSWRKNSNISVYFSRQKGKKNPFLFYNFNSKSTILSRKFKYLLDFAISNYVFFSAKIQISALKSSHQNHFFFLVICSFKIKYLLTCVVYK